MSKFVDVSKFHDGLVPKHFHNGPIALSGFSEMTEIYLPIGGSIQANPAASSEFFWLTNMGDEETKPSLFVRILHDRLPIVFAGALGENSGFELKYGDTVVISQDMDGASHLLGTYIGNIGTVNIDALIATKEYPGIVKASDVFKVDDKGNVSIKFPSDSGSLKANIIHIESQEESIFAFGANDVILVGGVKGQGTNTFNLAPPFNVGDCMLVSRASLMPDGTAFDRVVSVVVPMDTKLTLANGEEIGDVLIEDGHSVFLFVAEDGSVVAMPRSGNPVITTPKE